MNIALALILGMSPFLVMVASSPTNKGCCFHEKFHGRFLNVETGENIFYRADYTRRLMFLVDSENELNETYSVTDFRLMRTYAVKNNKCRVQKATPLIFHNNCHGVPDGKFALGDSKDIFPVSFYTKTAGDLSSSLLVQNNKGVCVPVMSEFHTVGKGARNIHMFFYQESGPEFPDMLKVKKLCHLPVS